MLRHHPLQTKVAAIVRDWMNRLTPEQVRSGAESLRRQVYVSDLPDEIPLEAVLAAIAKGGPAPVLKAAPKPRQAVGPAPRESRTATSGTGQELRGRPSQRAQALVRAPLADGPRRGEDVQAAAEAAEISECTLIAAASALGVRTRKGQWWIPGYRRDSACKHLKADRDKNRYRKSAYL